MSLSQCTIIVHVTRQQDHVLTVEEQVRQKLCDDEKTLVRECDISITTSGSDDVLAGQEPWQQLVERQHGHHRACQSQLV